MTHEELLAKVNQGIESSNYSNSLGEWHADSFLSALRAVVELHKPKNYIIKGFEVTESWCTADSESLTPYPCPTIQAIEKALNG